ncbi:MAG: hypothetical protein LBC02_10740, partial [Planctomycetaceae bacterium]|nr:hypothetical protein [Planctomycetaceae bacterium]
ISSQNIMTNFESVTREAYKYLIDKLVVACREGGGSSRFEKFGKITPPLDENVTPYREFGDSLNESQRKIFITILQEERCDAFHDVLAQLSWWLEDKNVKMTIDNESVPIGIEGDMHNDFVGRYLGAKWPNEQ